MSIQSDVIVRLDDRIRLISALLAATTWPEKSQERQPHGTHAHARTTRKYLDPYRSHEAVQGLQSLLDQGAPLEAMFTLAMQMSWPDLEMKTPPRWMPPNWNIHLKDFYAKSNLADWWRKEDIPWQKSISESLKMFGNVKFKTFLKPFLGEIQENFVFVPSISYPTDQEVGIRVGSELICIAPPRLAWGDSPPWPFDEDPAHIYRASISQYGRLLLLAYLRANAEKITEAINTPLPVSDQFKVTYPTWEEQFTGLFVAAAVAIYLEDYVSKAEANAYLLMERKVRGMSDLPGTISVLRRYLQELENGRYQELVDFLPIFPKQLRIAKRIVTL
jgi:hypothetical protein